MDDGVYFWTMNGAYFDGEMKRGILGDCAN